MVKYEIEFDREMVTFMMVIFLIGVWIGYMIIGDCTPQATQTQLETVYQNGIRDAKLQFSNQLMTQCLNTEEKELKLNCNLTKATQENGD